MVYFFQAGVLFFSATMPTKTACTPTKTASTPNINLRCFVGMQFLSQIYALFGHTVYGPKNVVTYKKWQYEVWLVQLKKENQVGLATYRRAGEPMPEAWTSLQPIRTKTNKPEWVGWGSGAGGNFCSLVHCTRSIHCLLASKHLNQQWIASWLQEQRFQYIQRSTPS